MKRPRPRPGPARDAGFVLVEIVIALGIVSFVVLAVLGLLSAAIRTNRDSQSSTVLALMARQVVDSLRQQPFSTVPNLAGTSASSPTTVETVFFDANGTRLQDASSPPRDLGLAAALTGGGVYQCVVTAQSDSQTAGLSAANPTFFSLVLRFSWPLQAAATSSNTAILHASLADYR